ncbi:MAG: hypothetical protein FWC90_07650 [Oscillospiraceae bacterium]|nr:hypothetical protein [Oscillospiraceae bacterium]
MTILKKRPAAIFITVVIAIAALIFSVNRSVNRVIAEAERGFYDGFMNAQGFREPSINAQFDTIINASLNILTVLANYPELDAQVDALRTHRRDLIDAQGIDKKMMLMSTRLQPSAHDLVSSARDVDLSERDMDVVATNWRTFTGATNLLINSLMPRWFEEAGNLGLSPIAELLYRGDFAPSGWVIPAFVTEFP